jgi:hypothetical protein
MSGVLEQIRWPFSRKAELNGSCLVKVDSRVLQLQQAKEILGEIFGIETCEVEEMIQARMEERVEWPDEFCLTYTR